MFLGQLPGLKDLVYACTHQVPACLLATLRQHHPRSRLHVHTFSLRNHPCRQSSMERLLCLRSKQGEQPPSRLVLARLEALVIFGYCSDLCHINIWRTLTDFSFLRRFTPPSNLKPEALDVLRAMAMESKFRSLRALNLSVAAVPAD